MSTSFRITVDDDGVRRQAALRLAQVHRAARSDDADAELAGRLHLRLDDPLRPLREEVVVVEDGAAAREREDQDGRTCGGDECGEPHGARV